LAGGFFVTALNELKLVAFARHVSDAVTQMLDASKRQKAIAPIRD